MKTSLNSNQRGSGHLVVILAVLLIAVVAGVAYRVSTNTPVATSPSAAPAARATTVPTALKTKTDVIRADASLDNTAIDSSVNPNQLDSDLNSLL